ncbi:lysylphosphatidylglycerol synthase transmembrane domain-containing protein [Marinoscillum sp.]|uniref:lysylphosphatidylglycerol synthase transmembrane domain-containing protein n=1 Tax=Marinoscillum sp. TaxID=2024838 RepID=UPI003BAA5831
MLKKAISVIKYVLTLGLAGVLLYFAFRNVDLEEFWAKASEVDYTWVILSIILSLVSYYARAYRWNILMKPLGYPQLNSFRTLLAVLVGYLANLAFPRLGEITRCGMMKRSDDVHVSTSLGTVISERIIDMFTLLFLIAVALVMEYDRFIALLQDVFSGLGDATDLAWKAALVLGVGGILGLLLLYFLYQKVEKVRDFLNELIRGLLSLKEVQNVSGFILSTVVLWVTYYFMSYLIVFSIPETADLPWSAGVMLLVSGGIALAIPVQGGIGTYHALISSMLVLYAVERTTGVFLATLLHTSQIVAVAVFGGVALIISLFINKHKEKNATK